MPRRTERLGKTLEEKAKLHANAIYDIPLRTYQTIDKFTFVFVPLIFGNKPNPPQIKVTHIVERNLNSGKTQRAIIDVRPVWIEGKEYNYYNAKQGYIEAYGESETVNNNTIDFAELSKWNQ